MKRRRALSPLLAWLAGVTLLVGGLLAYSGHVLSDSGEFASRTTATLRDGSMRAVIARGLSSQLRSGAESSGASATWLGR